MAEQIEKENSGRTEVAQENQGERANVVQHSNEGTRDALNSISIMEKESLHRAGAQLSEMPVEIVDNSSKDSKKTDSKIPADSRTSEEKQKAEEKAWRQREETRIKLGLPEDISRADLDKAIHEHQQRNLRDFFGLPEDASQEQLNEAVEAYKKAETERLNKEEGRESSSQKAEPERSIAKEAILLGLKLALTNPLHPVGTFPAIALSQYLRSLK